MAQVASLYSVYTGPTLVQQVANRLRSLGWQVTCEGTEHVHVHSLKPKHELVRACGRTWRDNDVQVLKQTVL
jgi:hypothetical protein